MLIHRQLGVTCVLLLTACGALAEDPSAQQRLGKNVTLHFTIEGLEDQFSVSTARQTYSLSSSGTQNEDKQQRDQVARPTDATPVAPVTPGQPVVVRPADHGPTTISEFHQDHHVQLQGEINFEPGTEMVHVTCEGLFQINRHERKTNAGDTSENNMDLTSEIKASALLEPGVERVLAKTGKHALLLTVEVE